MMTKQQFDYLDRFRKGEINYRQIPEQHQTYKIFLHNGHFQVCSVIKVVKAYEKETLHGRDLRGVYVETSCGNFAAIAERTLRAIKNNRLEYPEGGYRIPEAYVYQILEGDNTTAWTLKLFSPLHRRGEIEYYRAGCVAIEKKEMDLLLEHPLVKPFLK